MRISEAKAASDIVTVVAAYGIQLQRKGQEHIGLCPFHADSRPSLNVNQRKQVFLCPVCDTKGDVIDFVMQKEGCTAMEAAEKISGSQFSQYQAAPQKEVPKRGQPQEWRQVTPAPMPSQIIHHSHGKPSISWEYRDANGYLLGMICRFDTTGGKEIIPYTYRENDAGKRLWMFRGFDRPRPLYNLPGLANKKATVVIGEGEKTADAIQRLMPKCAATCWQGGAKAITATDWTPLTDRRVILWPDNDTPGIDGMVALAKMLIKDGITHNVKIVLPPCTEPKGWDLFDGEIDGWGAEKAIAYTLANLHQPGSPALKYEPPQPPPEIAPNLPQVESINETAPTPAPPQKPRSATPTTPPSDTPGNNRYFEVLGFLKDGGKQAFTFYIKAARMVVHYNAASLGSKSNLLTLAPLDYWEDTYPLPKRNAGGFSVDMAMQVLIGCGNHRGVFSPRQLRGRGAWYDEGRIALHLGSHLAVNGERVELGALRTRFVYEAGEAMDIQTTHPLEAVQAVRLMDVTRLLNWEREINAYLLAGWVVIAPFCGALRWRPHIWLTGGAGTGKSWVFKEVIRRLLGNACLAVQSETSEAGLRQMLASDAIPVVFDEAEGETRHALERMEHVLALMRAASSSDGGIVAKGTTGGRGQSFEIRSCFACASINSPVTLQADRTRVTNLVLVEPDRQTRAERWQELQATYAEVITADWVAGLQARTLRLLPTLLKNADVFSSAVAALLGQQRVGDQLGAMLAGAYSLHSSREVDYKTAMEFIQDKDWQEERTLQDTKDEIHLLATMAEKMVRVDGLDSGPIERNLGEMVRIAVGWVLDSRMTVDGCQNRLKRLGFKIEGEFLLVSTTSDQMRIWMQNTAWAKNYHRTLMRIPGAELVSSVRFASGVQSRAVKVPINYFK